MTKNFDKAFEEFQREISIMPDDEFWATLGTSIEELRAKQKQDMEQEPEPRARANE